MVLSGSKLRRQTQCGARWQQLCQGQVESMRSGDAVTLPPHALCERRAAAGARWAEAPRGRRVGHAHQKCMSWAAAARRRHPTRLSAESVF